MRVCQAEARAPCRHFLDQKKVAKEGAPQGFLFISLLRSERKSGPHFLCREKVTKSGRGAPRAPVRGDSHPAGGVGPACRSIRGRIRASTGPLVGLALPAPLGQGGGRQPSPPAVRGGIWADVSPLGRMQEMGPKRQPGTAAKPVAGQAAGPLGKPGASQNCPQLYQGESGGLEPSTKPVAGQAGATLHSLSP